MKKIDWSSLFKKEDWWAVWIGFAILLLGIAKWLPTIPGINKWASLGEAFPNGPGTVLSALILFVSVLVVTLIAVAIMGKDVRRYLVSCNI